METLGYTIGRRFPWLSVLRRRALLGETKLCKFVRFIFNMMTVWVSLVELELVSHTRVVRNAVRVKSVIAFCKYKIILRIWRYPPATTTNSVTAVWTTWVKLSTHITKLFSNRIQDHRPNTATAENPRMFFNWQLLNEKSHLKSHSRNWQINQILRRDLCYEFKTR